MSDPNGEDAMACLQIALVILALVAIAIATGGTGLVFAGAILGATAGAAAGGTIAASQYYNANGTLNGASEAVMGGVATGSMIGTVCGLSAGYGAELLMTAGTQTAVAASKGGSEAIAKNINDGLNFSKKAGDHMDEAARFVPVQTLQDAIKSTKGLPDPRGSDALMHYTTINIGKQTYNLEVLHDAATNTVYHFEYARRAMGNLPAIPK